MFDIVGALLAAALFALGISARRWSAALAPALLWALIVAASVLDGRVGDSEHSTENTLLFWAIFLLVPAVAVTALGVIAGKLVERARERRRRSSAA